MNYSDFFIAVYTNECKSYCDEQFLNNLFSSQIKKQNDEVTIRIVDNSIDDFYTRRLSGLIDHYNILNDKNIVSHIDIPRNDSQTQFQRNVADSVQYLRSLFITGLCKYFVILESDVIPPADWLHSFYEVIEHADVLGGIYYPGFHSEKMFTEPELFEKTHHVLSGCSLYKRHIVEKFPFRWSYENLGAFPDAYISYDINKYNEDHGTEYVLANYSKIKCKHLEKEGSINRGQDIMK